MKPLVAESIRDSPTVIDQKGIAIDYSCLSLTILLAQHQLDCLAELVAQHISKRAV